MATEHFRYQELNEILLSMEQFHPFPVYAQRQEWLEVTGKTKTEWLAAAEKYKNFSWPTITADHYLFFSRTGENMPYLTRFYERRSALGILVLSECLEGEGRFLDQIINGIYCMCEETSWITPFDMSLRKEILPRPSDRTVDLSCTETGALLAWTYYLLKDPLDGISPRICQRIEMEIRERLIVPYLTRDDYWWMGFVETPRINNWNPWCNKNMLMCFLICEIDRETKTEGIVKIMKSLDAYLSAYPPDGCCDEGPMYWGAAGGGLHTCLELLYQMSSGKIDIYGQPIVRKIGQYLYKVHIHDRYFVNFADGDALVGIDSTVYDYGLDIRDENLIGLGVNAGPKKPEVFKWFGMYEYLLDMFNEKKRNESIAKTPYVRDAWMDYTQVMTAREQAGIKNGFFLAAKGGHNAESHSHNDVGNFIVYLDGNPLLIDVGTEEYTAKNFSEQRYEIWYLQSAYHNCPTVRGILQKNGRQYKARDVRYDSTDLCSEISMDIAGAYPEDAGIVSWSRICRLNRNKQACVEIIDDYVLKETASDVFFSLMTPWKPLLASPDLIELEDAQGHRAVIRYPYESLNARFERIELEESRLKRNWGDALYRIVLAEKASTLHGKRKVVICLPDLL